MTENQKIINEIKYLGLPVFIWGNGELAELSHRLLKKNNISVEGRIVSVSIENKKGKIFTKKELNCKFESYIIIKGFLQSLTLNDEEVKKIFGEKCIKSYSLSEVYSCYGIEKICSKYVREHEKDFTEIYEMLEDNLSKKCLRAFLNAKIEENSSYLYPYVVTPQYFFKNEIWKYELDETLFDAGAYDGDSIKDFLKLTKNQYKKIIACEPDKKNMDKLERYIKTEKIKNITTICKGVSDKKGVLQYNAEGTMMSVIAKDGKEKISVDSIDSILKDIPVTIIKMDIEGHEKEALQGARKTIQSNRPMLFISAYHKRDDLFTIPRIIKNFLGNYKFFFRIHKPLAIDAVLYAIPEYRLRREE